MSDSNDKSRSQSASKKQEKQKSKNSDASDMSKKMGRLGCCLLMLYISLMTIFLIYILVQLWQGLPTDPSITSSPLTILIWTFTISSETRLLLIVSIAGSLGGLIHSLRSFYWYVGNRELVRSWWVYYVLTPFVGTILGVIFYLVIRGGFFSPQATVAQTSPFGFAAIAALVGMFSEAAVVKLKDVAENLLKKPPPGANQSEELKKAMGEKLKSIPITDKMITKDKMFFETSSDDNLPLVKMLEDLANSKKGNRIPIIDTQNFPRYVVHRSIIDKYLTSKAMTAKKTPIDLSALTLRQLVDEQPELKQQTGIISEDSTLADAKKVMENIHNCQDLFVTKTGSEKEAISGWITNVIIEEYSKI